jgi:Protein of unknown function (DUF2911)
LAQNKQLNIRKNMKYLLTLFTAFSCSFLNLHAQIATPAASPSATVTQQIGLAKATITYSRPSLRGRKMIGSTQIPYGKVWRTGANKVASIEISENLYINEKMVPKGKYALATIPGEREWTIILNKKADMWGVYEYKESEDFLRFTVRAATPTVSVETFTIEFDNIQSSSADVVMSWENTTFKFSLRHDAHEQIMAEIKAKTADPNTITNDTYYDAADYYLKNNIDLPQAYAWATKLVEKDPQSWTYALQAAIAAKMGRCDLALPAAQIGYEKAVKDGDNAEMVACQKVLEECEN